MLTIKLDADTQLVVTRGREAWTSLRSDETWEKWVAIGRAIEAGKTAVMRELGTNQPVGRRWSETFGGWLKETDFDQINRATRSRLQTCLDNLPGNRSMAADDWSRAAAPAQSPLHGVASMAGVASVRCRQHQAECSPRVARGKPAITRGTRGP